jgi:hypothetical protein
MSKGKATFTVFLFRYDIGKSGKIYLKKEMIWKQFVQ